MSGPGTRRSSTASWSWLACTSFVYLSRRLPILEKLNRHELEFITKTPYARLEALAEDPASNYRERAIQQEEKTRILRVPERALKRIQRRLKRDLFDWIPAHECSACVRDRGVIWAAERHQTHPFFLHLDLADFFPSVSPNRVEEALARLRVRPSLRSLLSRLVTDGRELPQGAPTSVAVSDIVLFPLDRRINGLARKNGLQYTRYVDDVSLSGGKRLEEAFADRVRAIVEEDWVVNEKGGVFGPDERHQMLGIIVNGRPHAAPEYVSDLRSVLRLVASGRVTLSADELRRLRARIAWVSQINTEQGAKLAALLPEGVAAAGGRVQSWGPDEGRARGVTAR